MQSIKKLVSIVSNPQTNTQDADAPFSTEKRHLAQLQDIIFKDIADGADRQNLQFFDRLYNCSGQLKSTANYSKETKLTAEVYFHHREKAEIALTVGSSWYGGDYFEFGSHDLATFRNMLSAYDICAMTQSYQDVRFYAFDIFGDPTVNAPKNQKANTEEYLTQYFAPYMGGGNKIDLHHEYIKQHNVHRDKCFLVQGLFENTLTADFKNSYKTEGRKIGFAFLDCNMTSSYKTVFEFIFDLMAENSFIYMDEYLQSPPVIEYYKEFVDALREKRGMDSVYIRNAGGFGGLFRLYSIEDCKSHINENIKKLNLKIT
jgi:hypothetical protein